MHNRKFGVEIECFFPGGHSAARELLREKGYPLSTSYYNNFPSQWSVGMDGSGTEIRTPHLQGKEGFATLRDVMNLLKRQGAKAYKADGLHVHHDAPEFIGREGEENRIRLERSWEDNEELIEKFVDPYRRDMIMCPKNKNSRRGNTDMRCACNLRALDDHGTVEIRLHEGTLNADQAIAWIKFGQYFLASVLKRKNVMTCSKDEKALLKRIRAADSVKKQLKTKRRSTLRSPQPRRSGYYGPSD